MTTFPLRAPALTLKLVNGWLKKEAEIKATQFAGKQAHYRASNVLIAKLEEALAAGGIKADGEGPGTLRSVRLDKVKYGII